MKLLDLIRNTPWADNAIASLIVIVAVLVLRSLLLRSINKATIKSSELRRRWIVQIRNGTFFLVLFALTVIWATELRTLALSLVAILVALVLSTKELILCLTGSFLKASSGSFVVGDRIEVNNIRGDVVDQTLLTTKLTELESGPRTHQHTGRLVTLPNSLFLTYPVINESFTDDYVLHTFTVPVKTEDSWQQAEEALLAAAQAICEPFIEEARRHITRIASREGLELSTIDPRITLSLPEPGRVNLALRIPVPEGEKGKIEQEILRRYLDRPDLEA